MFNRLNDTNSCYVIPAVFWRESTYTSTPGFLITTPRSGRGQASGMTPPFIQKINLYEKCHFKF